MAESSPPPSRGVAAPSVHVRALFTWLVIFPEVTLVNWLLSPAEPIGSLALRSFIVTIIVVPPAVYVFVPRLLSAWQHRRQR